MADDRLEQVETSIDLSGSLRRQRVGGGRKRGWGRRWVRWAGGGLALLMTGLGVYWVEASPLFALWPDRIELRGAHFLPREEARQVFAPDWGHSLLRVPLERRRRELEQLDWVRTATLERVWPDRLVVFLAERSPIAWTHHQGQLVLIDEQGVYLRPPAGATFDLPVVSGLEAVADPAERARRLQRFVELLHQLEAVRSAASRAVSDADLSTPDDVVVTLAGLPELQGNGPVVVHFGAERFADRFQTLLEDFPTWQQRAGRVEAVDLRLEDRVIVRPAQGSAGELKTASGQASLLDREATIPPAKTAPGTARSRQP